MNEILTAISMSDLKSEPFVTAYAKVKRAFVLSTIMIKD